ncbi:MAG: hypothetical protein ABI672_12530 [Vicinamibacteria bacterium]
MTSIRRRTAAVGTILGAVASLGFAQVKPAPVLQSAATPASPAAAALVSAVAPTFILKVTPQHVASLTAKDTKASEIGKGLTQELKVPVKMSALVANQNINLKMSQVPVERVLLSLAPQVYIDYQLAWDTPETWVGVELTGFNEREPRTPVEPRAFIVLAGSTEDENVTAETIANDQATRDEEKLSKEPPKEVPVLDVAVKNGLVSIRARKQMAAAVLLEVASKAGMGFETRGDLDQSIIDVDVRSMPIEQLPAALARSGFALLMRRNLATGGTRGVAVLLGSEASKVKKTPVPAPK